MAAGIGIGVAADTKDFANAIRHGMIDPTEEAQKALEAIGRSAQDGATGSERAFREQQQDTTKLEGELKQLHQTIAAGSKVAYQKSATSAKQATVEVEAGFDEMKDSARQNAIETAASFDGSFNSIAGGAQGLVSEFTAGFGPAGVLVGVLSAGAIGILSSQVDGLQQKTEAEKQMVSELTQELLDAGDKGTRSIDGIKSALDAMATDTDGTTAVITLQKAWDAAHKSGADYQEVVESIATADPQHIGKALSAVSALAGKYQDAQRHASATGDAGAGAALKQANAAGTLVDALQKAKDQAQQAERAQQLAAKAGVSEWQRKADLIAQLSGSFDDAAGSIDDYINKETGALDPGKYIKAMLARERALEHYKDDLLKADLSPAAKSYLESQGADSASAMVAGYKKASPEQKRELDRIWATAGTANASTYEDAIGKGLNGIHLKAPQITVPPISTAALDEEARKAQAYLKRHTLTMPVVVAKTPYGKPIFG